MKTASTIFAIIGHAIGIRPKIFIIASFAVFAISLLGPLFRLDVRLNLKTGFTRADAPSVQEVSSHIKFFNGQGEPWYMALFAVSRNGSILNINETAELTKFYKYITDEMPINIGSETYHFRFDLCQPFCNFNSHLWNTLEYKSYAELKFPLTTMGPYKLNIGKFLFERKEDENGFITDVGTVATYFTTFINDSKKDRLLKAFEEGVLREMESHNANENNLLKFVLHGAYTVTKEVQRGVFMASPYYIAGAGLVSIFVLLSYIWTSMVYEQYNWTKIILSITALLSPIIASLTAIGFILLFGFHVNMLVLISPFLTLAIGVDDAFLISNTWLYQHKHAIIGKHSPAERLQLVLEKIGVSITVTSLTNVLGFALGCIAPVPEIRLFCASVALSMLFDLIFQLTIYAPVQVLLAEYEPETVQYEKVTRDKESLGNRFRLFLAKLNKGYSKFLASLWAEFILFFILIGYFYISIKGIYSLKTNMDGKMLLPPDSQSNEGIRIMSEVVWPDYLSINYIIRKPPNFSDPVQYRKFNKMVGYVERTKYAIGPEANMLWVKDYLRYKANPSASALDVLFGFQGPEGNDTDAKLKGLDMSEFHQFINTEPYDAWKSGVHYYVDSLNRTIITEMLFMVGYKETSSLADKARILEICRDAASHFPQYDIVTFDTDSEMIDVILSVPSTTFSTMMFTVLAIGGVFLVLSASLSTALVAMLSVASICTGVLGFLHWWGCHLDPLTMVAVIMTAGLGVDFTVHIIFHYLMNEKEHENSDKRIQHAFHTCALSMIQAGISTFLVMLPVLFCPIGIYAVISKAIILVVILGLIHGLFIVPTFLATLPDFLTSGSCDRCRSICE